MRDGNAFVPNRNRPSLKAHGLSLNDAMEQRGLPGTAQEGASFSAEQLPQKIKFRSSVSGPARGTSISCLDSSNLKLGSHLLRCNGAENDRDKAASSASPVGWGRCSGNESRQFDPESIVDFAPLQFFSPPFGLGVLAARQHPTRPRSQRRHCTCDRNSSGPVVTSAGLNELPELQQRKSGRQKVLPCNKPFGERPTNLQESRIASARPPLRSPRPSETSVDRR